MAPNKQKVVRSGRKPGRPPKSQAAPSPAPSTASTSAPKPFKLKLTFKRGETGQPDERDAPAYQFPLSAPPSEDAPAKDDDHDSSASVEDLQGRRRGARQRKPPQRDDVVYGSEMDNLITSSATIAKVEDDDVGMTSSPSKYHFLWRSSQYRDQHTLLLCSSTPCPTVEIFKKGD